jgi:alpha-methylacyl-CoA racemase
MAGPLAGVRVVEMSGIGPGPLCGMLLADMGADVLRLDRLAASDLGFAIDHRFDIMNRNKRAVALDLKSPVGIAAAKDLISGADILIEGFRPGVMERLGLGPEVCHAINPRLVFGRMTGFGQDGPYRNMAGHDINYIALSGVLASIGPKGGAPVAPLNLVGDFGGGSLFLAMGVLAALHEAKASGKGQVVDAAMVDGSASLMTMLFGFRQAGIWNVERGTNPIDGGAPYYGAYQTRDGRWMAVGAIERKFYLELLKRLDLDPATLPEQEDRSRWDQLRAQFVDVFATKTRDEWTAIFEGSDACVSPVLDIDDCVTHPFAVERSMFVTVDGVTGPAPAPRFSRTPGAVAHGVLDPKADTRGALQAWGFSDDRIAALAEAGAIAKN